MRWRTVHVYHHDEKRTDHLVARAVGPLLRRIAPEVPAAYYVRHWRRGPHLRLNFRTDTATFDRAVRPALADTVGDYLARHPSTVDLDERALLPLHAMLARAEGDTGPLTPWPPDNSVREEEYDDRAGTAGGPEAAALLADFHVATTPVALAMARGVVDGGERLGPCFDLLLATAHAFTPGGLASGFVSFRSHAEGYLTMPGQARRRTAWDAGYRDRAALLGSRVDAVLGTLDGGTDDAPLVRDWVEALRPVHRRAGELVAAGKVRFDDPVPRPPRAGGSEFHRALLAGPAYTEGIRASVPFQSYRLMLNYLYLHLTRHGVRPVDRYLLCHLAANTVEDRLGVTALDLVSGRYPG